MTLDARLNVRYRDNIFVSIFVFLELIIERLLIDKTRLVCYTRRAMLDECDVYNAVRDAT